MSTDRELLEMAAKAAGLKIDKSPCNGGGSGNTGFDSSSNAVLDWHNGKTWNPLTDDGDALRLASKLAFQVHIYRRAGFATAGGVLAGQSSVTQVNFVGPEGEWSDEAINAATRRAIVLAAAAIGGAVDETRAET
jgi:hypothetical protein